MRDTLAEAEQVLLEVTRRRSPMQRLRDALQLSEDLRAVALQALRRRYPEEPTVALMARVTGTPLDAQVRHGPSPDR